MRRYRHQRMRLTEVIVLGEPQNGIEKILEGKYHAEKIIPS